MARPTITNPSSVFPSWATSGTGIANTVYPGATKQGDGWAVDERPPSSWFNWFKNSVGQWLTFLVQFAQAATWDHRKQAVQTAQALTAAFRLRTFTFPSGTIRFAGAVGGGNGTQSRVISSYIVSDDTGVNPPAIKFNNSAAVTFTGLPGTPADYAVWASAQRLNDLGQHVGGVVLSDGTGANTHLYEIGVDQSRTIQTGLGAIYNTGTDGLEPFVVSSSGASSNTSWAVLTLARLIIVTGGANFPQSHLLGGQPVAAFHRKDATGSGRTILALLQDGSIWRHTDIGANVFDSVVAAGTGAYVAADSGIQAVSCDGVAAWCVIRKTATSQFDIQYSHNDGVTWASVGLSISGSTGQHPTVHAVGIGAFAIIVDDSVFLIYTEASGAVFSATNGSMIAIDKLDAEPIHARSSFGFIAAYTGTGPMAGGVGKFPEA